VDFYRSKNVQALQKKKCSFKSICQSLFLTAGMKQNRFMPYLVFGTFTFALNLTRLRIIGRKKSFQGTVFYSFIHIHIAYSILSIYN